MSLLEVLYPTRVFRHKATRKVVHGVMLQPERAPKSPDSGLPSHEAKKIARQRWNARNPDKLKAKRHRWEMRNRKKLREKNRRMWEKYGEKYNTRHARQQAQLRAAQNGQQATEQSMTDGRRKR